jgi:ankyrin repeat protein
VVKWLAAQDAVSLTGLAEDGKVSLTAEDNDGWQPIHIACENGHLELVKWLAEQDGVSLTAEDNVCWQPIHCACKNGHLEHVKCMIVGCCLLGKKSAGIAKSASIEYYSHATSPPTCLGPP